MGRRCVADRGQRRGGPVRLTPGHLGRKMGAPAILKMASFRTLTGKRKKRDDDIIGFGSCVIEWDRDVCGGGRACQVIYFQFGLAIHQNDHQTRRRFVEWAQNEIAVVPDFHKRILFSDEAHFWLNGYVNKQNCRIWSEANPQVYVETPLHPEKLTVWCALLAGGIFLQNR
ncbi:hypothetical protein TNCV_4807381 [Trichonephila clavipes]|nr:hypothetical protein TNCV_4807381 [Trichonephila clavipes]